MLKLVERDSYLEPYSLSIEGRYQYFVNRLKQFTKNGRQTLSMCLNKKIPVYFLRGDFFELRTTLQLLNSSVTLSSETSSLVSTKSFRYCLRR